MRRCFLIVLRFPLSGCAISRVLIAGRLVVMFGFNYFVLFLVLQFDVWGGSLGSDFGNFLMRSIDDS